MVKIQEIKDKIKKEGAMTTYIKNYFNVTDGVLYEIVLSYLDFLFKINPGFEQDVDLFLKEETSDFFIDKLLGLYLLSDNFLNDNYFKKLGLKKGLLTHKGYIMLNEKNIDFNSIGLFFQSVEKINNLKQHFYNNIVKLFEEKELNEAKITEIKENIKLTFLKDSGLIDESQEIKESILAKEKNKLENDYIKYIIENYQLLIKEKILDEKGYNKIEEELLKNEKFFFTKKIFQETDLDLNELDVLINKLEKNILKPIFMRLITKTIYVYLYTYFLQKEIKSDELKGTKIGKKENEILKINVNGLFKKLEKLIEDVSENDYLIQELNFLDITTQTLDNLGKINIVEETKDSIKFRGVNINIITDKINNTRWNLLDKTKQNEILNFIDLNIQKDEGNTDIEKIRRMNLFIQSKKNTTIEVTNNIKKEIQQVNKKVFGFSKELNTLIQKINSYGNIEEFETIPNIIKTFLKLQNQTLNTTNFFDEIYAKKIKNKIIYNFLLEEFRFNNYKHLDVLIQKKDLVEYFKETLIEYNLFIEKEVLLDKKLYNDFIKNINKDIGKKNNIIKLFGNKDYITQLENFFTIYYYQELLDIKSNKEKLKNNSHLKHILKRIETIENDNKEVFDTMFLYYKNDFPYVYKYEEIFKIFFEYFKIDKFVYAFIKGSNIENYVEQYFINIIKLNFYSISNDIFKLKFLNNKQLNKLLFDKDYIFSLLKMKDNPDFCSKESEQYIIMENIYFLFKDVAEYIISLYNIQLSYNQKLIDDVEYENQIKFIFSKIKKTNNKFIMVGVKYLYNNLKEEKLSNEKNIFIILLNLIYNSYKNVLNDGLSINNIFNDVVDLIGNDVRDINKNIKYINDLNSSLQLITKLDILKLFYILLTENVVIEKSSDFFIIVNKEYAFVILSKYNLNILNSAILTLEANYKNKIHIFTYVNSSIFFFLYGKLKNKLTLSGISVFTKDLLSWLYYNNEVSDLDLYGVQNENMTRIKVRQNGTYQILKRYEGNSIKNIFSFNEFEQFINDLFVLGGTIGDQRVEDTRVEIGGIIFRISIMKDGNNMSLSARKTSSVNHEYAKLKGDDLLNKLTERFNFRPDVNKLFYEKDTVTLQMSYTEKDVNILLDRATSDRGIFLIIGKTRSGKSTSLRNFLDYLFETSYERGELKKLMTLEDPIEFRNINWNQIEVPGEAGALEEAINKGLKRQDPDIVVIGEIRTAATLPGALTVANNSATFSTMHITNPIDGLFTLKDFAKANGNTLMDVVNVLNVIISQKLVNKLNVNKIKEVINKIGIEYEALYENGITLFKNREEIEAWLEKLGILWLTPVTKMDFFKLKEHYKKGKLEKLNKEYFEGYLWFCDKTLKLYEKQGYLIKEVHKKYTRPKLYYDYVDRGFIDANMDLILRMDDRNSPIKQIKQTFVDTFELKEEKALDDYVMGEMPYFEGLNILDVAYYIYILRKKVLLEKED